MTDPMDSCDACETVEQPTPEAISNRSGLSAIGYRVGTYATFRQSMLRSIHLQSALKSWTTRRDDDFGIALFDMWAYILDILTFYQERIANEAYLSTATQPESLRRLTGLINYMPAPGIAASVYLAFLLQPPRPSLLETTLIPRLRVQSIPGPNDQPQKFETEETRLAKYAWNQLTPVQFQQQTLTNTTTSLYLTDRQTTIKPGDTLLLVGDEKLGDPTSERWDVRSITQVVQHPTQTEIRWVNGLGAPGVQPAASNPQAYILRSRASLFGFNAPMPVPKYTLVTTITTTTTPANPNATPPTLETQTTTTTATITPDPNPPPDWPFTRPEAGQPVIYLDAQYPNLIVGDWLVLNLAGTYTELYHVQQAATEGFIQYGQSGKGTRVTLDGDEHLDKFYTAGAARKTGVLFGAQAFQIDQMPVADQFVHGQMVTVMGDQSDLEVGRALIIQEPGDVTDEVQGEIGVIASVALTSDGQTLITLTEPLQASYPLATVEIYANVLYATHGETTTEALGSGDAAQAFEMFTLKKTPVTYVPKAGAPNGALSTLQVRVNDILWQEVASFYGHTPVEAIYTTRVEDGQRVVSGGDGQTGQRFPTGKNNVTASYRVGIGTVGNVKAGVLTTLLDRPAGVKKVLNPLKADGGADPEPPDQVRANAPNTVRTFGRIVSLRDFEDSARQYPGIAKARAEQDWNGEEQVVCLTVARDGGAALAAGSTLYTRLLADLDSRRDPNRTMELQDYTPCPVTLKAKIYIDVPQYLPDVVYAAALDAIKGLFAFENLNLGQAVYLSEVMATLQHVPGVVAVDVDIFDFNKTPPSTDVLDVAVYPNQLITLADGDLTLTPINGIRGTQL